MRMEDIDLPRNVEGSAEKILNDLKTLGISWEEGPEIGGNFGPYTQSKRSQIYESALAFLKAKGLVFPCFCTRREIREASSAPSGSTMLYPGTCRELSHAEQQEKRKKKEPSWRFRVSGTHKIHDEILGDYSHDLQKAVGDFVLKRADGLFAYQLAVVVDDILMGVSDIVRGEDLLSSTPRQAALFSALESPLPKFWHVPLLLDSTGEKMSKRVRSVGLSVVLENESVSDLILRFSQNLGLPEPESTLEKWVENLTMDRFISALRDL